MRLLVRIEFESSAFVRRSVAGKIFTMFWILSGICIISTFTGMVATIMNSLMVQDDSTDKPFYDQRVSPVSYFLCCKSRSAERQFDFFDMMLFSSEDDNECLRCSHYCTRVFPRQLEICRNTCMCE